MHTCPNCGYCPHCGRSRLPRSAPYYPWVPATPPPHYYGWPSKVRY